MYIEGLTMKHFWKGWGRLKKRGRIGKGVDGLRISDISDPSSFVQKLFQDVQGGGYRPDSVREAVIQERGKSRKIGIVTVRDYLVQSAVIEMLQPYCESRFLDSSYAYRPRRSAMQAADVIADAVAKRQFQVVVESDFKDFFDSIDHQKLLSQMLGFYPSKELWLKRIFSITLQSDKGLVQGAPISPLLSNLFLHMFDHYFQHSAPFYLRYSDDFILLTDSFSEAERLLDQVHDAAKQLELQLNGEKTDVKYVTTGFDFLGHRFDTDGKRAGLKAVSSLEHHLKDIINEEKDEDLFQIRVEQAIRGWEQYFGEVDWSIFEDPDVCSLSVHFADGIDQQQPVKEPFSMTKEDHSLWKIRSHLTLAMKDQVTSTIYYWLALLEEKDAKTAYELYIQLEDHELTFTHFTICMTYLREMNGSKPWEDVRSELVDWLLFENYFHTAHLLNDYQASGNQIDRTEDEASLEEKMITVFAGQEGTFGHDLYIKGIRRVREKKRSWTVTDLHDHLNGEVSLAQYLVRENGSVNYAVLDVDVLRPWVYADQKTFEEAMNSVWETTRLLSEKIDEMGFMALKEFSGQRGYHLWFFFQKPVSVEDASAFLRKLIKGVEYDQRISIECFPKQTSWKKGMISQAIKIPGGLHPVTGKRSTFVNDEHHPLTVGEGLAEMTVISSKQMSGFLAVKQDQQQMKKRLPIQHDAMKLFSDLQKKCPVLDYYMKKVSVSGHLMHEERLFFLSLAGPLGEDGKAFIHSVMEKTGNYHFAVTERYNNRAYNSPISCPRIREKHPDVVDKVPCHCKFQIQKGEYPTPLLHIESFRNRVFHQEQPHAAADVNKIEEAVKKLSELRKQKRGIDRAIEKTEQQLSEFMDETGKETIQLQMGELSAVKGDPEGRRWVIRI